MGLNPYFVDAIKFSAVVNEFVLAAFPSGHLISEIFFYGAGCSTVKMNDIVKHGLLSCFPSAAIYVFSDMIAAARALCGDGSGYIAILGTGSNSCAYKNGLIIEQSPSLGYILGDEGSGTDLGKKLLRAYCYEELGTKLQNAFELKYELKQEIILEAIYKKTQPNRFIASFVSFIRENLDENLKSMVADSFRDFLTQHIKKYRLLPSKTPLHVTGSVGWVFSDILIQEIKKQGLVPGNILQSPLEGLIKYHTNQNM